MKTEVAAALIVLALAGGFLLGRKFPAHHYQPWKDSNFFYDTNTGAVCDPVKNLQTGASRQAQLEADKKANETPDDAFVERAKQLGVYKDSPTAHLPPCQ